MDIEQAKQDLIDADCYSRDLGSKHNNQCRSCPHLDLEECSSVITPFETFYVTSITRVLELQSNPLLCYSAGSQLYFLDEYGVIVVCRSTMNLFEYDVVTAFRDDKKTLARHPSKKEYYESARRKFFSKYTMNGKFIVLRN